MKEIIQQLDFSLLYSLRNAIQCPFLDFLMPKITMPAAKAPPNRDFALSRTCRGGADRKCRHETAVCTAAPLLDRYNSGDAGRRPARLLLSVWPYAFLRHRGDDPVACGASLRHRRHTARGTDRFVTAVPVRTLSDRHSRLRCHRYSSRRVGVEIRRSLIASGRVYAVAPEGILKRQKYRQAWQASYPNVLSQRTPAMFFLRMVSEH